MINWIDSGRMQVGSKSLEYRCFGPAPDVAATIVLLHEGLGCAELWRDFPQLLSDVTGMGVFVYSRAGYGQSDLADLPRPLDYMTREALEVLPLILQFAQLQRFVLMGHSDGATIAAIYAGSVNEQSLCATVLIAPHFFTEAAGLAEIAAAKKRFETTDIRDKMAKYHRVPEHTFKGWNNAWLDPAFEQWHVGDVLDKFRLPTLAIQGRQDQYGSLAQIAEIQTRAGAPVEVLIVENCKHSPHIEQRDVVLKAIAEFIKGLQC